MTITEEEELILNAVREVVIEMLSGEDSVFVTAFLDLMRRRLGGSCVYIRKRRRAAGAPTSLSNRLQAGQRVALGVDLGVPRNSAASKPLN